MNTLRCLLLLLLMALPLRPVLAHTAGMAMAQPSVAAQPFASCERQPATGTDAPASLPHHSADCAALCALPLPASVSPTLPAPLRHIWHANTQALPLGLPVTPPHAPPRAA